MNTSTTFRAVLVLVVVAPIIVWSGWRCWRRPRISTALQALGAGGLLVVIAAHVCEGLQLFPRMGWGQPRSAGHYLDLTAAIVGLALVPVGYLLSRVPRRRGA